MDGLFSNFPNLSSPRLDLIEIKQEHLKDFFKIFSDDRVTRYYNIKTLQLESDGQKYLDWFNKRYIDKMGIRWGIALKGQESIIGTIGYNNFTINHKANIGYDLAHDFWNKGYITEALKEILHFGFNNLYINRIDAEVMPGNIQSEKVLQKLGFAREGTLRQWMYWDNKYYDMIMYSLLFSDFKTFN